MKRALRNLAALLIGDLGSRALGFLVTAYLARVLDPSGFGLINIGFSVLGYLVLAASPGMHLVETRNAATMEGNSRERVQAILSLRSFLALGAWCVGSILTLLLPLDSTTRTIIILSSASLIPLALSLDWFFHGKEQFALISTVKVVNALVYGIAAYVLVESPDHVSWVPIAFAVGNVAASLLYLYQYRRRFGTLHLMWRVHDWKDILRRNVPVGLSVLLAHSTLNLPPIVVGVFLSNADAGMLSAALKVVFVLLMIDRILHALFFPVAARHLSARNAEGASLVSTVGKLVLAVLLPMTVCAYLLSPVAISFVFGENYSRATALLQILLGYFLLTVVNTVFVCALIGSGHEREYVRAVNIGSGVLTVAIVVGTLLFGTTGTAVGIVLGELGTVMLMMRGAHRVLGVSISAIVRPPAAAGLLMGMGAWATADQHLAVQLVAACIAYSIGAVAFRVFERRELEVLRERFV